MLPVPETVLVVCEANQIRSPLFAQFLQRSLRKRGARALTVTSAGRVARRSETETGRVAKLAQEHSWDYRTPTKPRQLTPGMVKSAELVVAMTESLRAAVITYDPASVTRTFSLPELVRLLDAAPGPWASVADLAAAAHRARPSTAGSPEAEDVVDPAGRSSRTLQSVVDQLQQYADQVAEHIAAE